MLARRISSFFRSSPKLQVSSYSRSAEQGKGKSFGRKAVSFLLITVTGGVALSALDDLLIYRGCTSKAIEKASKNQAVVDAIGEPIIRGPWYNASLAVAHRRHSVSCTFPVSGPHGTGILQLKAVRNGGELWNSFIQSRDWEILIMEAQLHVPSNEEKQKTFRISLSDGEQPPASEAHNEFKFREPENPGEGNEKSCT